VQAHSSGTLTLPRMQEAGTLPAGSTVTTTVQDDTQPNGHRSDNAARSPLLNPLPQAGEEANERLRAFHVTGPQTRTRNYTAPFALASREADYKIAWAFFAPEPNR